jgi:hypothetical protein
MAKTYLLPVMAGKLSAEKAALEDVCIELYSKVVSILTPTTDVGDDMQLVDILVNGVIPPTFNLFYAKLNGYLQSNYSATAYILLSPLVREEQIRKDVELILRVSRPWDVLFSLFKVAAMQKSRDIVRMTMTDIFTVYAVKLYNATYGWCDSR